jgi:hypothetical protein
MDLRRFLEEKLIIELNDFWITNFLKGGKCVASVAREGLL